jgi:DNA polymerase-4
MRDKDFNTITRQRKIDHHVDRDDIIYITARRLFEDNNKGVALRLLGVSVSGLVKKDEACSEPIFNWDKKYNQFIKTMDSIRDKFGEKSIKRGAGIGTGHITTS